MALGPLPPSPPNPNPTPTPKIPPGKTPEGSNAITPFGEAPILPSENCFREPIPDDKAKSHQKTMKEALKAFRALFEYRLEEAPDVNGETIGLNFSQKDFGITISMVIGALESGYHPSNGQTTLNTTN